MDITKPSEKEIVSMDQIPCPFHTFIADDCTYLLHRHQHYEAFYVILGKVEHTVNGVTEILRKGDTILIFPGAVHTFKGIEGEKCSYRNLLIRPDIYEYGAKAIDEQYFKDAEGKGYLKATLTMPQMVFLEDRIATLLSSTVVSHRATLEKLIAVYYLSYLYSYIPENDASSSPFSKAVLDSIAEHFNKPNAYDLIRKDIGYNEKYFCQKFKKTFGMNLVTYITQKRMDYADYLLKTTSMTIVAIADEVGIESVSHFHKLYYKKFGRTPAKARKEVVR